MLKTNEIQDIRSQLLLWLHPFILGLILIGFLLTIHTNPSGSYERKAYSLLLGLLAIISVRAYFATRKQNYPLASLLVVVISLVGSWGSIFIDSRNGLTEFFPLIYVCVTVLFSSILLSLPTTIIIAALHLALLTFLIFQHPALLTHNWASFLTFVLIVSVVSIVGNYIISHQLKQFRESAIRDHLTGLFNRRYFDATLEEKIYRSLYKQYTYGIMLMDIDNFKHYNDQYSHGIGDEILQRVSIFLQEKVEIPSIVCRYGGDEFAVLIPNTDTKKLYHKAERLRTEAKGVSIADICQEGEQLSLSIGLALFPDNGKTGNALMAHADKNLLVAKQLGKNRVMI